VGAHELAQAHLGDAGYAHARGVAQQAARLARMAHLARGERARLLAAAWLHDLGEGLGPGFPPLLAGRALRRAGHEPLARLVAHRGGAAMEAALRGLPPVSRELPAPAGGDALLLTLLNAAEVTTGADGARITPAARLRELTAGVDSDDPCVRVLVALVARMGADPMARALVEHVAPRPVAAL
jgi:hypothetical protein